MTFLELEIGEFWKASKTAKKKLKTLKILWIKDFPSQSGNVLLRIWKFRNAKNPKIKKQMNESIENEENVFEIEDYTTQELHHY